MFLVESNKYYIPKKTESQVFHQKKIKKNEIHKFEH